MSRPKVYAPPNTPQGRWDAAWELIRATDEVILLGRLALVTAPDRDRFYAANARWSDAQAVFHGRRRPAGVTR